MLIGRCPQSILAHTDEDVCAALTAERCQAPMSDEAGAVLGSMRQKGAAVLPLA